MQISQTMKTLFSYQDQNVFISAILDTRRANTDGNFPVKVRVAFQSKKIYYSTGKYLSLTEWKYYTEESKDLSNKDREELKDFLKKPGKDIKGLKKDIETVFEKIKAETASIYKNGDFSLDSLNRQLKKSTSEIINIAFAAKIEALNQSGQIGTKISYECALHSLENFAGKNIAFNIITPEWLRKYERTLISEGKTYTTIGFYLRCLRAILNSGIKSGVLRLSQYPFGKKEDGKYQIQTGESRKLALSKDQIKEIVNYTDGSDITVHYRNLWYFSLLCNGANFTDILKLKYKNISNGEISFIRQKTSRTSKVKKNIVATLTPTMQDIIKSLGNPVKSPDNYIFPYLTGHETPTEEKKKVQDIVRSTNFQLSKIGKALGIEGLNTYSARHSYTNILLQGGAPVALIADQLGHANIKTTQGYLAGFGKDERKKYSDLFSDL